MGRFLDYKGVAHKARRQPQQGDISGQPDQDKLLELVKKLAARVQELEAKASPEWLEVELTAVQPGVLVSIEHRFNAPVRYWPVHCTNSFAANGVRGATPTVGVMFSVDPTSTSNVLVLNPIMPGGVAWKVVLRIEPSQYGAAQ